MLVIESNSNCLHAVPQLYQFGQCVNKINGPLNFYHGTLTIIGWGPGLVCLTLTTHPVIAALLTRLT